MLMKDSVYSVYYCTSLWFSESYVLFQINCWFGVVRLPLQLSCMESMIPLHSAVSSARLISSLSVESRNWALVPQGLFLLISSFSFMIQCKISSFLGPFSFRLWVVISFHFPVYFQLLRQSMVDLEFQPKKGTIKIVKKEYYLFFCYYLLLVE